MVSFVKKTHYVKVFCNHVSIEMVIVEYAQKAMLLLKKDFSSQQGSRILSDRSDFRP